MSIAKPSLVAGLRKRAPLGLSAGGVYVGLCKRTNGINAIGNGEEVFRLQEQNWLLTNTFDDTDDVCAPPFDALTFPLGLLWPFDPPTPETPSDEQR